MYVGFVQQCMVLFKLFSKYACLEEKQGQNNATYKMVSALK
jgi:hypothetical protein